ncbi:MAG: hypothetical protein KGH61_01310 [Candidatus Micrarchaeota archaeon]|nr:hypothetical protein [Candidatus Micrarchaeota archaeon]MDE1847570.1 hypothetical protein [Candidatus Micrarchaeota archaeon]MDE1864287.1 hypothetical protein [Candidatus Micrarchaeota archaeon]
MAAQKNQKDTTKQKGKAAGRKEESRKEALVNDAKKERRNLMPYAVAIAVIAIIAVLIYYVAANYISVPFSTYKSTILAAPRVGVLVAYANDAQYANESLCSQQIIEFLAHSRSPKTIDLFYINQQNSTCLYDAGLGYPINYTQKSAGTCIGAANSEPGVSLNYTSYNSTSTSLTHFRIFGNAAFYSKCSLAADFG